MRISPIVLLLVAMLGCGQPVKPSADSGGNQAQQREAATPEKLAASSAAKPAAEKATAPKTPDAATVKKHMTPDQLALGDPIVNSVDMVLVPIPAGEFQMGSPDSETETPAEKPQHLVRITKPFYLSVYEVTRLQYEKVTGVRRRAPDYPVTIATWHEAVEFCRKLSEQEGVEYRLPTEAQWEYACRAGTTTAYSFGDDVSKLGQHAWCKKNSWDIGEKYTHRVGLKLPNAWGLYDMYGNVSEWCQDWSAPYGSEKALSDPVGPAQGERRVLRGGSFGSQSSSVRSATRYDFQPADRSTANGFRVARTYP